MTYEENLERLNEIIRKLGNDKLPLDEALELYKEGISLSAECQSALENAKQQVRILDGSEDDK